MPRKVLILVLVLSMAGSVAASDSSGRTCEELEKMVTDLAKRVEALEKQLAATRARTLQPRAPRPQAKAKPAIDPLYKTIDDLLAAGAIDKAQQALAERKASPAADGQQASWLRTLSREMEVVGKPTPQDWGIEKWYQGGSEGSLDDGGTTLLVFWEAWCPHCKSEVPRLQKVYDDFKGKGLMVVGLTRITKTATEESVQSFISDSKVGYPIAKETGAVAEYFNVKGIPAAAVIRDGKIIWRGHPLRLTDEMLKGWL
jgi:thiol-disulfide isomerase/thioredoxin